jgi:chromosome segregation ATPase
MDAESVKPLLNRPRVLRQRSQSAVTPTDAVDSDTSKRSSLKHRQTHSHHHIPHHPKRFAKDILGLQNEHSLADLSKQTSRISESSRDVAAQQQVNESRKASTVGYNPDGAAQSSLDGDEVERMVWKEQWKNKARQSELRSTLHTLSEESMKTTRRLDDLYYDLLEKVSGLRSTINNLQELSGFTAQLHGQFKTETSRLTSDLQKQINGFKGFKTQQSKIDALDLRVKESKKKADGLSARLEAARERVSALEIREQEWQDSVSCTYS